MSSKDTAKRYGNITPAFFDFVETEIDKYDVDVIGSSDENYSNIREKIFMSVPHSTFRVRAPSDGSHSHQGWAMYRGHARLCECMCLYSLREVITCRL